MALFALPDTVETMDVNHANILPISVSPCDDFSVKFGESMQDEGFMER
jgi:hypothetical protein